MKLFSKSPEAPKTDVTFGDNGPTFTGHCECGDKTGPRYDRESAEVAIGNHVDRDHGPKF